MAVQWLPLCAFTTEGAGSVPGQRTKLLQAEEHGQYIIIIIIIIMHFNIILYIHHKKEVLIMLRDRS